MHGTVVCRQQLMVHQPCIYSIKPWKIIYAPHLSHHLSYIICILTVRWPCSLLTICHPDLFFFMLHYIPFFSIELSLFISKKKIKFFCLYIDYTCCSRQKDPVLFFQCHSNSWEFLTQFFSRLGIRYRWVILFFGKYANVCHLCSCFSLMCVNICVPT